MAPTPKNLSSIEERSAAEYGSHQGVVISGMAGIFPECNSVKDLSDILYNKINPVSKENCRWKYENPELSNYSGTAPGIDLFDAQFFKVFHQLGDSMEPMVRKLLEKTYEAIFDAGICPIELSGKKVCVYIGNGNSETEMTVHQGTLSKSGLGLAGCCRAMFANRISYWLNAKGPSMTVDEFCCSSTKALELAYLAIKRGECDAAIVGGACLCAHPFSNIHFGRIMKLSKDGKTKSFDSEAAGYVKSEAVGVLFLQKAEDALRVYADVVHVKSMYLSLPRNETGPKYGFCRDPEVMANFIRHFYEEAKVSPQAVEYVEGFGSADLEADKAELEALEKVYCNNRRDSLLVGSVISNIGYTEGSTGISAITKILLGYHHGQLAGNLHCESPRQDIDSIRDGRMRIVTDNQAFGRTYAAVNSISLTGINAHVLLHGHYKPKDILRYKANFPQLVVLSGRQESSVDKIIQDLKSRPIDPEELVLLRNVFKSRIPGHLGRGFVVLDTNEKNETVCLCENRKYFDDVKRPLWFVYSGMGSQWPGMGKELMRIPVFAAAIERCRRVLEPKGVDIVQIITSPDKTILDNILNCFVGITAIQIGLTDVLRELKIFPDMIIGHSAGELGCAYADECFTAEEAILAAYSRGLVSVQTPFIRGSMAAVGIGYQQISKMCPPEIEVACHNGPDSSTISGPADIMKEFVASLSAKAIFAKEVPCSNIAYHSRYIAEAGPGLLKYLKEVIKSPKERSKRWISTSVPEEKWDDPTAKYSSAEYHTNNLLNSVLFEESIRRIPSNAVLVEIAPHGLLQAILKRSLPESCKHVPLTRRGHPDNAQLLLEAIGNIYMEGHSPLLQAIYPKVEFPVSTGTPMLSHLVEWAHNENWNVLQFISTDRKLAAQCTHLISIHDDHNNYLTGHMIRGKNTYPFSAILVAVWDTLAMILEMPKKQLSVQFRDVHLLSQPILHDQKQLRLSVAIHRGNGRFEVMDDNIKVATGFIFGELDERLKSFTEEVKFEEVMELKSNEIYQLMHARDYNYWDEFRSIQNANTTLTKGHLWWKDNWVTFVDGMIQLNALRRFHDGVSQPYFIRRIEIDPTDHIPSETLLDNAAVFPVTFSDVEDITRCGGVTIETLKFYDRPSMDKERITLKTLDFVPHISINSLDEDSAMYVFLQILAENLNKPHINLVEVIEYKDQKKIINIHDIIRNTPEINITLQQICRNDLRKKTDGFFQDIDVLIVQNLAADDNMCEVLHGVLNRNTFLINHEEYADLQISRPSLLYRCVSAHTIGSSRLELDIWRPSDDTVGTSVVTVFSQDDFTKLHAQLSTLPPRHKFIILTLNPPLSGIKELIKEWRNKDNRKIHLLISNSHKEFDEQCLNQMPFIDLTINILKDGIWGAEYCLPVREQIKIGQEITLEMKRLGDIDSLHWTEATKASHPGIAVKEDWRGSVGAISMIALLRIPLILVTYRNSKHILAIFNRLQKKEEVLNSTRRIVRLVPFKFDEDLMNIFGDGGQNSSMNKSKSLVIRVQYVGLNDACVKKVLGNAVSDNNNNNKRIEFDFSGTTESKVRVMGLVQDKSITTCVNAKPELLWPVPQHWTLEDAATVPLAYCMAFYCLCFRSRLYRGNSILVHGGAGALGQAVISIALAYGCEIYTTVSSIKKKQFLLKLFPELKEDHIGNSRDCTFKDMVLRGTKGKGCHIVISCVTGDLRTASIYCSTAFGFVVDTSLLLDNEDSNFEMYCLENCRSYSTQRFSTLLESQNANDLKKLQLMVSEGIAHGYVRPLTRVVYEAGDVSRALRLQAGSKHVGRVLLHVQETTPSCTNTTITCSANRVQLLLLDNELLGMQLADRLISRGARKLLLHCSNKTNTVLFKLRYWEKQGVQCTVSYGNVWNKDVTDLFNNKSVEEIEGVYCVLNSTSRYENVLQSLENLTSAIKRSNCSLNYFAVIDLRKDVSERINFTKLHEVFTIITLPPLKEIGNDFDIKFIPINIAVDAIEKALCYKQRVIEMKGIKKPSGSLLQEVAHLADIVIPHDASQEATLKDLGMELVKLNIVRNSLYDDYNIILDESMIPLLTIKKIQELEDGISKTGYTETRGLQTFFSNIEDDILVASLDITILATLTNSADLKCDELHVGETFLCIVPGVEGLHIRFHELSERLKLPVVVLQPGVEKTHETIQEIAHRYVKILQEKTQLKRRFYILGYESGVLVALEMAAILEDRGLTGTIFCLGGAPNEVQAEFEEKLSIFKTEESLQHAVARHMFSLLINDDKLDLEYELKSNYSWDERIYLCVQKLTGRSNNSIQYTQELIKASYARIVQVRRYSCDPRPLRSLLISIRPSSTESSKGSLQSHSQQPVVEYNLETPLAFVSQDLRCAAIVNRHLDNDILEQFEKKSLCTSYITNPESFMHFNENVD